MPKFWLANISAFGLFFQAYGSELEFFAVVFRVVYASAIYEYWLLHVFGKVFWSEFFEFFSFRHEDGCVCVFEAANRRGGILDFVLKDSFCHIHRDWVISSYCGAFL